MVRDGMMQRNTGPDDSIRAAYGALQEGRFTDALALAGPVAGSAAGMLLQALARAGAGDVEGGADSLAAVAQANPRAQHPVLDLVGLLRRLGRPADGVAHLRAAAQRAPNAAVWTALGEALASDGPMGEALAAFQAAAAAAPGDAAAWSNLGKALAANGLFPEAEAAFDAAAALAPGHLQIKLNHAVARLKSGRWREGWGLFRVRHLLPGHAPPLAGRELPGRELTGRELTGLDDIAGRRILLVHDEGLGDTIQFIRYAPLLTARGAAVTVLPAPALRRLMAASGLAVVDRPGSCDAWIRIPDLPGLFGTTPDTVPPPFPFTADPANPGLPPGRRVGLVWAGAARAHDPAAAATDRVRSIDPRRLAPLLEAPGIDWVSLQLGQPAPPGVYDAMTGVQDFADTAAIIAGLDMVVSIDSAVAHLAASLGRPTLLLDRFDNCWRWLSGRSDTPWYPGAMRILRQPSPGDWDTVLRQAAQIVAQQETFP